MFLRATGAEIHLMGRTHAELDFARSLGFEHVWSEETLPELPFDAVIDTSNASALPALALDLVEPAGRVVYIGLARTPSVIDTRTMVFKDVTAIGVLSGSPTLDATIRFFAEGTVDPRPLVAATLSLEKAGAILAGERPADAGPGPKFHFDPRL
jgi:D-arabinose 1-dehydrogenase-like Zn-dependent alcohol dehydrogenase